MRNGYLFHVRVIRTNVKFVEAVQVPAVQRDRVAYADHDQEAYGDQPSEIPSQ
jgi:hypothetical protein